MSFVNMSKTVGDETWNASVNYLYINFPVSYSYTWLIWNILHESYKSSMGMWVALDILQL